MLARDDILIIADLHLSPKNAAALAPLDRLIERAAKAKALYILGDLVDYWVGDDQPVDPEIAKRFDRLAALDTPKYLQHGNRDFLMGEDFAKRIGATLLPEEYPLEIDGVPVVLAHGDHLCTDDAAYQGLRLQLRSPEFRCDFLAKPLEERITIAEGLRARSKAEASTKPEDIMDVNAVAVDELLNRHQARILIHGHTHRPAIHRLADGRVRVVTGDWGETGWVVAIGDHLLRLERFDSEHSDIYDQIELSQ